MAQDGREQDRVVPDPDYGGESDQGELPSMEQQVDVPAVISGEVVEVVQHMVRVYQDPGCGGRRYGQRCASGAPYAGPDPNRSDSVSPAGPASHLRRFLQDSGPPLGGTHEAVSIVTGGWAPRVAVWVSRPPLAPTTPHALLVRACV